MLDGMMAHIRPVAPASAAADRGGEGAPIAGPAMAEAMRVASRVAASRIAIILSGETGTGKEVLARYIHDHSPASNAPMISVNCGAIPRDLIENTFFGHERGAFTGANQARAGVFESAGDGTVFLDEIGELPPPAQTALLRVLETRCVTRIGGTKEYPVGARVIAATHRDLMAMVEAQQFRADLYFRLSTITIELPPLRHRREDIEPLARRLLRIANLTHGRCIEHFAPEVLACFASYVWPGNVRELRNIIERAVVLAQSDVIGKADLPEHLRGETAGGPWRAPVPATTLDRMVLPLAEDPPDESRPSASSLRARVLAYEAQLVRAALDAAGGNRREAAHRLGMPLRTLAYKLKSLNISARSVSRPGAIGSRAGSAGSGLAQHAGDRFDRHPPAEEPLELGADLRRPIDGCFFV
ncbi:MAG TPA: sigma 54-interacting transcriptional regulator [Kofleriaceae bacterium]|jgi:transcriptional regulator with PAS, ATPase and Fis domain|nr:sigma 54-interacting transcriptional regulator [Kofleriaceae bacterium]